MEYEIVNSYGNASVLQQPICGVPFSIRLFISLLEEAAYYLFPASEFKVRQIDSLAAIRLFERFLEVSNIKEVIPDEILLKKNSHTINNALEKPSIVFGALSMVISTPASKFYENCSEEKLF